VHLLVYELYKVNMFFTAVLYYSSSQAWNTSSDCLHLEICFQFVKVRC